MSVSQPKSRRFIYEVSIVSAAFLLRVVNPRPTAQCPRFRTALTKEMDIFLDELVSRTWSRTIGRLTAIESRVLEAKSATDL